MAKGKKVGIHGTDAETGRNKGEEKGCAITRAAFEQSAPPAITLSAQVMTKKFFETGTFGYFGQISMVVDVNGVPVKMSGNAMLFVPKSKEA